MDGPAVTPRSLRQFACLWMVVVGGLACVEGFARGRGGRAMILATLAAVIGPVGIARPGAIRPLFLAAMAVSRPIGALTSRVLLAVLFYGVFMPVGVVFRLVGRDALDLRRHAERESYLTNKPPAPNVGRYLRQF